MVHQNQWKELTVDLATIHKELQITEDEVEVTKLTFSKATLDSVEHLTIGDSPQRFQWAHQLVDYSWDDDASPEFHSSWQFPSLKTLVSEVHIPPPGKLPNLTEFTLDLSIRGVSEFDAGGPKSILDALADFLNSQPSLKTFELIVDGYTYYAMGRDTINLPELRTLHLENRYAHRESVNHIVHIVGNMDDLGGNWTSSRWVSTFFPHGERFGSLGNFRLEYTVENIISSQFLRDIKWFPDLKDVDISTPSAPDISNLLKQERWIDSHLIDVRFRDSHPNHKTVVREYHFDGESMSSRSFFE